MSDADWNLFERCLACGVGACNTMGTASSMAIVTELLGLMLPGGASDPGRAPRPPGARSRLRRADRRDGARRRAPVGGADDGRRSRNAVRGLHAVGGSTNVVLHLLAIAGRAGVPLRLDDVGSLGRGIPVVADVEPSGKLLMQEFHAAGGVPALVNALGEPLRARGRDRLGPDTWAQESAGREVTGPAILALPDAIATDGAFAVVRGSLAPGGGLLKTSAASPRLFRHRGPAVVFRSYDEMRAPHRRPRRSR